MSYRLLVSSAILSVALLAGVSVPKVDAGQSSEIEIGDGESHVLECLTDALPIGEKVNLKLYERKTISCGGLDANIELKGWGDGRVFYCNHDNWYVLAGTTKMRDSERILVACATD